MTNCRETGGFGRSHSSRFAEADSLSLPGETVSEARPARLSLASKIPFLAAIWQEFGRVDNLQLPARSRHQGAVDFAGSSVRTEAEILELRGPGRIRITQPLDVDAARQAAFHSGPHERWCQKRK
jgi:hypothetical protein